MKSIRFYFVLLVMISFTVDAQVDTLQKNPAQKQELPDFMRLSPQWALEKLESLTLEEKIAQSFMVAVNPNQGETHFRNIDNLVKNDKIGGIITFKATLEETKTAINRFQKESEIPLLVGIDGEWGAAMRITDVDPFPYHLTMGAANDLTSTNILSQAMAKQFQEIGIHINFAPDVDVNTNPNNPIIGFRSFGEGPNNVGKQAQEMILGMQEYHVLSCMKHFPGHGDTDQDSHKNLPTINKSYDEMNRVDWLPYKMGRLAGASAVMVAHLNVPSLDSTGLPSSISPATIKGVLRKDLKFKGLVISDALNMHALTNHYGAVDIVRRAYMAGNDILLYPSNVGQSIDAIVKEVNNGNISINEVNEKALRILRAKYYAEIHNHKAPDSLSEERVEFAKNQVYEKAITVVKNDKGAIPVQDVSGKNLILNIARGGTSKSGAAFTASALRYTAAKEVFYKSAHSALQAYKGKFKNYDHILINLIASSNWPWSDFHYPSGWRELVKNIPAETQSYVTFFGNPYVVDDKTLFTKVDGVLLAFQDSKMGQDRAAQLIFGGYQANSVLPITLSIDYPEGFGIQTPKATRLKYTVPMDVGATRQQFNEIDSIVYKGIHAGAFPGCQVIAAKDGKVVYQKSFGYQTYDEKSAITNKSIYDIASITKIMASTYSLMHLQDQHRFSLDSTLETYLPNLTRVTPYKDILLRDMMAHQARLKPWIPFYIKTLIHGQPNSLYYTDHDTDSTHAHVADHLYMLDSYEDEIYKRILMNPLRGVKKYKYSDLGYYFVKRIIEKETEQQMEDYVQQKFYSPMGLTLTGYHPLERFKLSEIVPTEKDDYFRHQLVHGYVHDMGAAMMDGVGGHAGIFTTAGNLAGYMQMLLNGGVYGGKRYLSEAVIKEYTSCQFCPSNRRGAGFDKPVRSLDGGPTCKEVSLSSFGHAGFTGTLAWADPEYDINYVFISNRVYPSGENWKIVSMDTRTEIQRVIYEALK